MKDTKKGRSCAHRQFQARTIRFLKDAGSLNSLWYSGASPTPSLPQPCLLRETEEYSMGITTMALWYLEISQSILAINAYSSFFFWCLMKLQTHGCVKHPPWLHPSSSTTPSFLLLKNIKYHKHSATAEKSEALFEENTGITRWICTGYFFFLAEKKNYHLVDISAVVSVRSPGSKVTHKARSPWQHI